MSRHQLRAARALLFLRQEVLAELASVGVASIRRFENGTDVSPEVVDALRAKLEEQGAVLLAPGATVDGRGVGEGVALKPAAELPAGTKARLRALDASPEDAAASIPQERVGKVGRRTRVPYNPGAHKQRP